MNIMYFLTPKIQVSYLRDDLTIRQALEKMDVCTYTALPMLDAEGHYIGTITEGDILRYIKKAGFPSLREIEKTPLVNIPARRAVIPSRASASMEELFATSLEQNFVPVVDDRGVFIGIITRRSIMKYFFENHTAK